jgi:hypothetical protein
MRRTRMIWLAMVGVAMAAGGCASAPSGTADGPAIPGTSATAEASGRGDRNRITEEEMADMRSRGATDALTLIERARPNWLRVRRVNMREVYPMILYNDRPLSTPNDLRGIPAAAVQSMEYISPPASQARYGTDAQYGVVIVRGR